MTMSMFCIQLCLTYHVSRQRLLPLDNANELMANKSPEHPLTKIHLVRPYRPSDEAAVRQVWSECSSDRHPSFQQYPDLSADR